MEKLDNEGIRAAAKQVARYYAMDNPSLTSGMKPDEYAEDSWKYFRGQARAVIKLYFENTRNK